MQRPTRDMLWMQPAFEKYIKEEIELFYLPPYAPEYNPDELLNSDLKRGISKKPSPRSDEELEHNVRSHLKTVQLRPNKIRGFFHSKTTKYAS
ncbi:transposase [Clostridiaceae bacterium HFYG-1003]|nr:transposase [Clostridiaceae bacterium HFYG-1003]